MSDYCHNVLDHLLNYKNGIEASKVLEKELESAIHHTLENPPFRIKLGSLKEYWQLFNAVLETLTFDTNETCLINLIKLTRNVVAGIHINQQLAIQHGSLLKIEDLLKKKLTSPTDNTLILKVGTQAVCNIITDNPTAIDFIWRVWMSSKEKSGYVWSLILAKSNDDLIMSALILILNCVKNSTERCQALVSNEVGRDIIAAILGDLERLHGNESCKNFELGYSIINELIQFGHFKQLYRNVDDLSDKSPFITEHQTILLKLLDSKIHAKTNSSLEYFNNDDFEFLVNQFDIISQETIKVIQNAQESVTETDLDQVTNVYTAMVLLLQIINELLLLDTEHDHERNIKRLLLNINALQLVTDMLGRLETIKLPPIDMENPTAGFNYLKRECVRLIGTLVYKDQSMQDKIRDIGGIPLILCQFKIDDSNPYLREYATVTLRNLMENNPENQKLIQELEPQQVVQTAELDEMNITPEITKEGKLVLKRSP